MATTSLLRGRHIRRPRIGLLPMSTAAVLVLLSACVPCSCLFGAPSGNADIEGLAPGNEYAAQINRGDPVSMDRYPYMVSLRNPDDGNAHMCGGALIRPTVVLTAAHCLEEGRPSPPVHVWIDEDQGFEAISVARAVRHDAWNLDWKDGSDIALLFLSRPAKNPKLLKLMPQPENLWSFMLMATLGWGDTNGERYSAAPRPPDQLQKAEVFYQTPQECKILLGNALDESAETLARSTMCVIEGPSGAITCSGDSGGPLVVEGSTWEEDVAVGVLSFGAARCWESKPSVFTRLSAFDGFIRNETALRRMAAPERFPYMVSLHHPGGGSQRHICGGTLVSPNMVLTAAHCLDEKYGGNPLPLVRAWYGSEQGYKTIPVIRTGNSAWERDVRKGGDAALLLLAWPVPGAKVPALLPYRLPAAMTNSEPLTAVGWEVDRVTGTATLVETEMWYRMSYECEDLRLSASGDFRVPSDGSLVDPKEMFDYIHPEQVICATKSQMAKEDCARMDSGGPLIISGRRSWEDDMVMGLLSFDATECNGNNPTIFTSLSYYRRILPSQSFVSKPENLPDISNALPVERSLPDAPPLAPPEDSTTKSSPSGASEGALQPSAGQPPQIKRVLSQPLPDGPRASHTFSGLSGCPRIFVSVKAKLIDMSYYNEWENIRARISGARDKPSRWSKCRFNSAVDKDSTCGEEGYVMCGEDSTASVGPSGDLTVQVLGSKHITQPCDDGVVLSALVTVECSGSSEVICPRSEMLDTSQSRHCMDESSFFPPSLFPSPPTSPARLSPPPPPPTSSLPPSAPPPSPLPTPTPTPTKPPTSASSLTSSSTVTTSTKSATTPSKPSPPNPPSWSQTPTSMSPPPPSSPPSSPPPPSAEAMERWALLAFKQSTERNKGILADWRWNKPTCTWESVVCSSAGRVTELDLIFRWKRLTGTLPREWSVLRNIEKISLNDNSLSGTLPREWSALDTLKAISLNDNSLTGTLPREWSALDSLKAIRMNGNLLTGTLPREWSALESLEDALSIAFNSLTGTLPPEWSALERLVYMRLHRNSLTGTLPREWSALEGIERMYLYNNSLTGTMPREWSALNSLDKMWVHDNDDLEAQFLQRWPSDVDFRTSYPSSPPPPSPPPPSPPPPSPPPVSPQAVERRALLALKESTSKNREALEDWRESKATCNWDFVDCSSGRVTKLDLSNERLTGTLPLEWSALDRLEELRMNDNSLTGTLPPEWSALERIKTMRLYSNALTGTLPREWSALESLGDMDLSKNSLRRNLPQEWSALEKLGEMNLHENSLTGTLPREWSALESLEEMRLQDNSITGTLPREWSALESLQRMYLNDNSLTGAIPREWSALDNLNKIWVHDNEDLKALVLQRWPSDLEFRTSYPASPPPRSPPPPRRPPPSPPPPSAGVAETRALMAFKQSTSKNNEALEDWKWSKATCNWDFVDCSSGRVTKLDLSNERLTGTLPREWSILDRLEEISLNDNSLTGTVPREWSALERLKTMRLQDNSLTGTLPPEWSALESLGRMDLSENSLRSKLPREWSTLEKLEEMRLQDNSLTGTMPREWSALERLELMWVHDNDDLEAQFLQRWPSDLEFRTSYPSSPPPRSPPPPRPPPPSPPPSAEAAETRALMALKTSTSKNREALEDWRESKATCNWDFVDCSSGRVTKLDLSNERLTGTLPREWSVLDRLEELRMNDNSLTGTVPREWSALERLKSMRLQDNSLTGTLPGEWSALRRLRLMDLAKNSLRRKLPEQWSNLEDLKEMRLQDNSLTGTLPRRWSALESLEEMYLHDNSLTGTMPREWSALDNLDKMWVHDNEDLEAQFLQRWPSDVNFRTSYPASPPPRSPPSPRSPASPQEDSSASEDKEDVAEDEDSAVAEDVEEDAAEDAEEDSVEDVERRALLALKESTSKNRDVLEDWRESKPTCSWAYIFCSSGRVTEIALQDRGLTGTLPRELSALDRLEAMYLSDNSLTGTLPPQWSAMKRLVYPFITDNSLTGTLPPQWSAMKRLKDVYLSDNSLTGTLPRQWSAMKSLVYPSLHKNSLTGTLPRHWSALDSLVYMNLEDNFLTGTLPREWSALDSVWYLWLSNNRFSSTRKPSEWDAMDSLQQLFI